jgi:nitroreductase
MGQATLQMMVVAADLGIGSSHAGIGDQDLTRRVLGIPGGRLCVGMVAFGYPAERPLQPIARPARRSPDEVIHRERW